MDGIGNTIGADQLFRAHARYIKAFLLRLGVLDIWLDDAVQDVFLIVWARGGYQVGPASERTWLGAIAVRVAANARRKQHRQRIVLLDNATDALKHYAAPPLTLDIERVLHTLSEADRDIIVRFYLRGEECVEIARALEIPVGTVYRKLHEARKRFIEVLHPSTGTSTSE